MSNWISVKDRLPSCDCEVFVYCSDGWKGIATYETTLLEPSWIMQNFNKLENVTHWMFFPDSPKGN